MDFPILTTNNIYYYLLKCYKKNEITNKCQFQGVVLPLELWAGHLDHQCSSLQLGCTCPWKWLEEVEHWSLVRQRPLLLLQNLVIASILIIPCLVSAPHCSFKSRPYNSLLRFTSNSQQDHQVWVPDHGSSAARVHIEHHTHEFLCMSQYTANGGNVIRRTM
jgi:hypothetical protein